MIKTENAEKIVDENNIDLFLETSAKSGFNVNKIFCEAAKILFQDSKNKNEVAKVRMNIFFINVFNNIILYII